MEQRRSTTFFPSPQTLLVSFGGAPDAQQRNTLLTMGKQVDALQSRSKDSLRQDLLKIQARRTQAVSEVNRTARSNLSRMKSSSSSGGAGPPPPGAGTPEQQHDGEHTLGNDPAVTGSSPGPGDGNVVASSMDADTSKTGAEGAPRSVSEGPDCTVGDCEEQGQKKIRLAWINPPLDKKAGGQPQKPWAPPPVPPCSPAPVELLLRLVPPCSPAPTKPDSYCMVESSNLSSEETSFQKPPGGAPRCYGHGGFSRHVRGQFPVPPTWRPVEVTGTSSAGAEEQVATSAAGAEAEAVATSAGSGVLVEKRASSSTVLWRPPDLKRPAPTKSSEISSNAGPYPTLAETNRRQHESQERLPPRFEDGPPLLSLPSGLLEPLVFPSGACLDRLGLPILPPHVEKYALAYQAPNAPGQVAISASQKTVITQTKNGPEKWKILKEVVKTLPKHPLNLHPSRWSR